MNDEKDKLDSINNINNIDNSNNNLSDELKDLIEVSKKLEKQKSNEENEKDKLKQKEENQVDYDNKTINVEREKQSNNNSNVSTQKPKFVPSYVRKNESKIIDDKSTKNRPKKKLFKSKITKIWIVIIFIVIVVGISVLLFNMIQNKKYAKYESYELSMDKYGFNLMYENESAKASQKVTKQELVKVVVSSLLNRYDISDLWYISEEEKEYENQEWVDYAIENELISSEFVNKNNYKDKATLMDALNLLSNYKVKVLNRNLDIESNPSYTDYDKYTNEEQTVIKDMVWNKIIDNESSNLNANKKIIKGELNKLVINFVEKYNTITLDESDKLNISTEKLPYNYEDYTYTLANINKTVYEAKFDMQDVSKSILPKDMYVNYKEEINRWIRMLNYYYTAILNVNYNNFDKVEFMDAVNAFSITNYSEETINEYEDYLKTNKIIINGSAKVQMPIIYFDGENIRIRMRIQYDIKNSNTDKNILFGDLNKVDDVEYKNDSNILFIDAKLIPSSEDFNTVFIANTSINELAINNLK